ncbi:MAG TPA: glutamate--tRNA ligase family protein [Vicinamibacterales bacterium]
MSLDPISVPPTRPDMNAARARFAAPPVTRFAPSPTGYLHLGHIVNAIYTWGLARALDGRVLLRVEDHDRIRSRPEFIDALLEDLDWLGFRADLGREPLLRQSERDEIYRGALDRLRERGRVYACDCSRTDIGGERYGGRCRTLRLAEAPGRGLRVRIDEGPVAALDLLQGPIEQVPSEQCGDLLVKDRDGHWTYQFAATVDDWQQGVTLVIRGADLESSTGRQVALARLLGRDRPPIFLHHPLIVDADGRKLSKSAGDTGVRELRSGGMKAADMIGLAASAVGLLAARQPLRAVDLPALFDRGSPSLS